MRLEWSPRGFQRAREIAEHIRQDDPSAAEAWLQELFRILERVVRFPDSGRVVPEVGKPEFREALHREYRVVYRRTTKRVSVLTIRHGRQLLDLTELERRS
jgi:toxin ParE1/3/4